MKIRLMPPISRRCGAKSNPVSRGCRSWPTTRPSTKAACGPSSNCTACGYTFYCTCRASRRTFGSRLPNHQLHTVSAACGFELENHHHALADAEACAQIALKIL